MHYKSITRIDNPNNRTYGWLVRVSFGGKSLNKLVSDSGRMSSESLKEALYIRDSFEKLLNKPRTERIVSSLSARNKTGFLGVRRCSKGGYVFWETMWCPEPKAVKRRVFSVNKYGEKKAQDYAKRLRTIKELEIYNNIAIDSRTLFI